MAQLEDLEIELKKAQEFITSEMLEIVGTEAVKHFSENFEKQGFDGKPWKDVKRRNTSSPWLGFKYGSTTRKPSNHPSRKGAKSGYKPRKANAQTNYSPTAEKTRILSSQRAELENSLRYKVRGRSVTIFSDKPYAKIHNEGGKVKVFGKTTATIPKRQFIGKSAKLDKKLKDKFDKKFDLIFKKK